MKVTKFALALSLATGLQLANATELNTDFAKLSYTLGSIIGKNLKQNSNEKLDINLVKRGMSDVWEEKKSLLSEKQMEEVMLDAQKKQLAEQQKMLAKASAKNGKMSKAFLAENAKKDGVHTTKSGLQYKVLKMGKGAKPTLDSVVTINYRGELINGKVFDDSYKRKQPTTFPLKNLIKGWQEGLQLMPKGSVFVLYLPPYLGYGDANVPNIGPQQVLIFKISLLDFTKKNEHQKK